MSAQHNDILSTNCDALLFRMADAIAAQHSWRVPYISMGCALNALVLQDAGRRSAPLLADMYYTNAASQLDRALALQDSISPNSSLYKGVTGLGWAVQVFDQPARLPWRDEFLAYLDQELTEALIEPGEIDLDIVNGFAGICVYALARGNTGPTQSALWGVLCDKFFEILSSWIKDFGGPQGSKTNRNLGVAHGMPGIIGLAATAVDREYLSAQVRDVVLQSLDVLWGLRLPSGSHFPYECGKVQRARLGWCYGGLGIAAVYRNSLRISQSSIGRFQSICNACVDQYADNSHGIEDASLCHGHAGVALAFAVFARTQGIDGNLATRLLFLADRAAEAALALEVQTDRGPSFLFSAAAGMRDYATFLEGGPGVALALSAARAPTRSACLDLLGYY